MSQPIDNRVFVPTHFHAAQGRGRGEKTATGLLQPTDLGRFTIDVLAPDLVHLLLRPPNGRTLPEMVLANVQWEGVAVEGSSEATLTQLRWTDPTSHSGPYTLTLHHQPLRVQITDQHGIQIFASDPAGGLGYAEAAPWSTWELDPAAHLYGFGEKTGPMDKRGERLVQWATDCWPHLPTSDPLYQAIPFFLGVTPRNAFGLFFCNAARSYFDMGKNAAQRYAVGADEGPLDLYLFLGPTVQDVLNRYTQLTGRMPLPPRWALGYQQSRYSYTSQEEVLEIAENFRKREIPCDGIVLDIHYMDDYRVFTWDPKRFPDPPKMLQTLTAEGFRVVTIVDPGVKVEPGYSIFDQATQEDLFLHYQNGAPFHGVVWPGVAALPDFLNERTRRFWGACNAAWVAQGIAGIWNDMNEPALFEESQESPESGPLGHLSDAGLVQREAEDTPSYPHTEIHNLYGFLEAKATYEGLLSARPQQRPFLLTRSGFAGIGRYAAVWTGDNSSWWEHLDLAIRECLNLSLSGVAFCGPDIGGFIGDCTPELYARWIEAGVFFPFCRTHSSLGTARQEPWSFGPEVEAIAKRAIQLRYRLLPWLYTLFWESAQNATPILRPLWWNHPDDEAAHRATDAFLLGDALLVAPITAAGARSRIVYLPRGNWYEVRSGRCYKGGQTITAEAPLDAIPLFLCAGQVLPMVEPAPSTAALDETTITLLVTPGEGESRWYQDAGEGFGYRDQDFALRTLQTTFDQRQLQLSIGAAQGHFVSPTRRWRIVFLLWPKGRYLVTQVSIDGQPLTPSTTEGYQLQEDRLVLEVAARREGCRVTLSLV